MQQVPHAVGSKTGSSCGFSVGMQGGLLEEQRHEVRAVYCVAHCGCEEQLALPAQARTGGQRGGNELGGQRIAREHSRRG